jgi:hypothetical protein
VILVNGVLCDWAVSAGRGLDWRWREAWLPGHRRVRGLASAVTSWPRRAGGKGQPTARRTIALKARRKLSRILAVTEVQAILGGCGRLAVDELSARRCHISSRDVASGLRHIHFIRITRRNSHRHRPAPSHR